MRVFFRWAYYILFLLLGAVATIAMVTSARALEVPVQSEKSAPHIIFFQTVGSVPTPWAKNINHVARAVAVDLDLNLEIIEVPADQEAILTSVENRLETAPAPDYVLMTNHVGEAPSILSYLNKRGIKIFLLHAGLEHEKYEEIGRPREKLVNWIGELIPAEEQAGYDLAKYLIQNAIDKYGDRRLRIIGLTGSYLDPVANERVRGLRRAVEEYPQIDLLQVVSARWSKEVAESKYPLIQGRYGDIDIVWAANDLMALGVLKALSDESERPVIGGMDWAEGTIAALYNGELDSSFGGQIIDIAYALVLLKKYALGEDFADVTGQVSLKSSLVPLTRENIEKLPVFIKKSTDQYFDMKLNEDALFYDAARGDISLNWFLQTQRNWE